MSLSKEEIIKNGDRYMNALLEKTLPLSFFEAHGQKIFTSPYSVNTGSGAYDGAFIEYVLKAAEYAVKLNKAWGKPVDDKKLLDIIFLNEIGKFMIFEKETEEWKINKGQLYKYKSDMLPMTIQERSIALLLKESVSIDEEVLSEILNLGKSECDKMIAAHYTKMSVILRSAIKMAHLELK